MPGGEKTVGRYDSFLQMSDLYYTGRRKGRIWFSISGLGLHYFGCY